MFGTFFQDLGISAYFLARPAKDPAVQSAIKATLMCVEMLIFASAARGPSPRRSLGASRRAGSGPGRLLRGATAGRRLWRHRRVGSGAAGRRRRPRFLFDVSDVQSTSQVARGLARRARRADRVAAGAGRGGRSRRRRPRRTRARTRRRRTGKSLWFLPSSDQWQVDGRTTDTLEIAARERGLRPLATGSRL